MNTMPAIDDEPDIPLEEPEIPLNDEPDVSIEEPQAPRPEPEAPSAAVAAPPMGLMEVLPADFRLPALINFVPDVRLRATLDEATRYALAVDVSGPEGLQRADLALGVVREGLKAIEKHFEDPKDLANKVHKRITSTLSEWAEPGETAVKTVGRRIATEQSRLAQLAADARRKAQEEEDRKAREQARQRAADAERQRAPAPVVAQMRRAAETVTAPPVPAAATEPPKLSSSTVVKTWKSRIVGTPADADPNPAIAEMTPAQIAEVMVLLQNILNGKAPITAIEMNWSVANQRAKADKSTFNIPGLEAFEDLGVRSKGSRGK